MKKRDLRFYCKKIKDYNSLIGPAEPIFFLVMFALGSLGYDLHLDTFMSVCTSIALMEFVWIFLTLVMIIIYAFLKKRFIKKNKICDDEVKKVEEEFKNVK